MYRIKRLYYLDGKPYIYFTHYLPGNIKLDHIEDDNAFSIYMQLYKNKQFISNFHDEFYIEEKNAETYLKLRNRIKLTVKKEEKSNKYQVSKIFVAEENTKKTVTLDVSRNKTVTLNGVALKDSNKTVSITVSIDDNNNISVTIPNEDLNGEYKIELVKKSEDTGKIIGNVPFLINNVEKNTDAQTGKITVTDGNDGIVAINRSNVDNKDVYTIQEQKNENTKKYTILSLSMPI